VAYPSCDPPPPPNGTVPGAVLPFEPVAVVKADKNGLDPVQIGANIDVSFGLCLWVALFLPIVGVEIYLRLARRESQRLRMVSYERQLAVGYKTPGGAGFVVEKFGDTEPWMPRSEAIEIEETARPLRE